MSKIFDGKKLLMLGTNVGSVDMVKYARENGAYTIVADFLPKEKSLAKQYADADVLISTAATDELDALIKQEKIDAVFAGVSEFNMLQAMELSRRNGLRYYCTREQWDRIESKDQFRQLCIECGVPSPKTYYVGSEPENHSDYELPVIVKPVDSSASIGITICKDAVMLHNAFKEALDHSDSGKVIVEEFFEGDEFAAHYTIVNGQVTLSSVDNRCPVAVNEGDVTTIPIARFYPSTFIDEYLFQVNDSVIKLCESLKMDAGVLFVQGLYNKQKNKFCIFEAGLRCAGEGPYRIISKVNGISFIHNFIDYALLGKVVGFDMKKEDPKMNGKVCGTISFVCKGGGKISKIIGIEETVKAVPQITDYEYRYHEGDMAPAGNTLRQILLRFVLVCDNKEQMSKNIDYINCHVDVFDETGKSMCVKYTTYNDLFDL